MLVCHPTPTRASHKRCLTPALFLHCTALAAGKTILFMARIAAAAWPLLLLTAVLIVGSVGVNMYQLDVQVRL